MLTELKNTAQRFDGIEEEQLRSAGYNLLSRQFLHRAKQLHRKHYEVVVRCSKYFIHLMDALNYNLVIEESLGYVGAIPGISRAACALMKRCFCLRFARCTTIP